MGLSGAEVVKMASAVPPPKCDDERVQAAPTVPGRLADELQRFALVNVIPRLLPVVAGLRSEPGAEPVDPARDYLAIRFALSETAAVAGELADERISRWLSCRVVVLTTMAAAVAVLEAAGMAVDRRDDPDSHLNRARRWRAYGAGPVVDLHRRCAEDITRGSLALLAGPPPEPSDIRLELQRTRLQLVADGRARSAAVRRELQAAPIAGRVQRVDRALRELFTTADAESAHAFSTVVGGGRTTPWRMPVIPGPPDGPRRDEWWLSLVLGAGFGFGVALATMRLVSGLGRLSEAGGATVGLVVGLILTGWVVIIRARMQQRAALDRWVSDAVATVRQAAEDDLARRWLDVQGHLVRPHHKSAN